MVGGEGIFTGTSLVVPKKVPAVYWEFDWSGGCGGGTFLLVRRSWFQKRCLLSIRTLIFFLQKPPILKIQDRFLSTLNVFEIF